MSCRTQAAGGPNAVAAADIAAAAAGDGGGGASAVAAEQQPPSTLQPTVYVYLQLTRTQCMRSMMCLLFHVET